jgi:hypothetical protein
VPGVGAPADDSNELQPPPKSVTSPRLLQVAAAGETEREKEGKSREEEELRGVSAGEEEEEEEEEGEPAIVINTPLEGETGTYSGSIKAVLRRY